MRPNPIINITLFCAIIFSLLFAAHQCTQNIELKKANSEILKAGQTTIRYQFLKDGSFTAEKPSVEITGNNYLKQVLQNKDSINQLKERINRLSNLANSLQLQLAIKGKANMQIRDTVYYLQQDTVMSGKVHYQDQWLCLNGLVICDSLQLDYKMEADLDIATYRKGKTLNVNVKSNNPNLLITGMNSYQIQEKKKFYQTRGFCLAMGIVAGLLIPH